MKRDVIKDFYGKILGYVETKDNGDKVAKDFYNKILGYYRPKKNTTTDFYGKILGSGDFTSNLVIQNSLKETK